MEFAFGAHVIRVNVPDQTALLAEVGRRLRMGEGFALATLNLDHLAKLRRSAVFRTAYAAHELVVADGNPVVWLSRMAGRPVELVPGADLVLPLLHLARDIDVPVGLVGSTAEALAIATARLEAAIPGLRVVARIAPPMGFDPSGPEAEIVLRTLQESGARLCLLALGAPTQEVLAARGREQAAGIGFASVGAGLDFIAGHQLRAPYWVRMMALEWMWRLLFSPRRMLPRYVACLSILPGEALAALGQRRKA